MVRRKIFRAYDVRGVYPTDINEATAYQLGLAFAEFVGRVGKVVIGHDVRLSGYNLARSLALGLTELGCEVYYAGVVPTPLLYLAVVETPFDAGIQVTASHNPPEWNGFKFVLGNGETVSEGNGMERLRDIAQRLNGRAPEGGLPEMKRVDLIERYVERISGLVRLKRRVRVAVDFTNGAACLVGKRVLERIGCEVIGINDEPDGRFPAHLPEPTRETLSGLVEIVKGRSLDFGVGFDGDGDRAVFLDERGRIIEGDLALAIYVINMGRKGSVVYDVSSSSALEEVIRDAGCTPVVSRVGRAFMLRKVREVGAVIGGEKSNHLYFSEIHGFDDGLLAAAKMAEIVSNMDRPLSELIDSIPSYPSAPIKSITVPDEVKFEAVRRIAERLRVMADEVIEIDGVKAYMRDGWILIRPSNTMPQIKYTAEARSEESLRKYLELAEKLISEAVG